MGSAGGGLHVLKYTLRMTQLKYKSTQSYESYNITISKSKVRRRIQVNRGETHEQLNVFRTKAVAIYCLID